MHEMEPIEEVQYSCGHVERVGGNIADPCGLYAEAVGLISYRIELGICTTCRNPELLEQHA